MPWCESLFAGNIRREASAARNVEIIWSVARTYSIAVASEFRSIEFSIIGSVVEAHRGQLWASTSDEPGRPFAFCIPHGGGTEHT